MEKTEKAKKYEERKGKEKRKRNRGEKKYKK
jgi:hypothetical protein